MALTIQFAEYSRRAKAKINSGLNYLGFKIESIIFWLLRPILVVSLLFFFIFLLPILLGSDYEAMLKIAEFGIIGSGTLAILIFTYAIAKGTENCNKIVRSGEQFLKSTVFLILGLGLLPLVSYILKNHKTLSDSMGTFVQLYDTLFILGMLYIMIVGMVSLTVSGVFFVFGIKILIEVFETSLNPPLEEYYDEYN